jgi:hypothetical protein
MSEKSVSVVAWGLVGIMGIIFIAAGVMAYGFV